MATPDPDDTAERALVERLSAVNLHLSSPLLGMLTSEDEAERELGFRTLDVDAELASLTPAQRAALRDDVEDILDRRMEALSQGRERRAGAGAVGQPVRTAEADGATRPTSHRTDGPPEGAGPVPAAGPAGDRPSADLGPAPLRALAVSADGRRLVALPAEGGPRYVDLPVGEVSDGDGGRATAHPLPDVGEVSCVAISADGRRLALGTSQGSVLQLALPSGQGDGEEALGEPVRGVVDGPVTQLAFQPGGRLVAAGLSDPPAVVLVDRDGSRVGGLFVLDCPAGLAFSSDGHALVCLERSWGLTGWTLQERGAPRQLVSVEFNRPLVVRLIVDTVSPPALALRTEAERIRLVWTDGRMDTISPAGQTAAEVMEASKSRLEAILEEAARYNVHVKGPLEAALRMQDEPPELVAAAFSPGGGYLATARNDGELAVWRLTGDGRAEVHWRTEAPKASHLHLTGAGRLALVEAEESAALRVFAVPDLDDPGEPPRRRAPRPGGGERWWNARRLAPVPDGIEGDLAVGHRQFDLELLQRGEHVSEAERQTLRHGLFPRLARGVGALMWTQMLGRFLTVAKALGKDAPDGMAEKAALFAKATAESARLSREERALLERALGRENLTHLLEAFREVADAANSP